MKNKITIFSLLIAILLMGATQSISLLTYGNFNQLVSFGLIPGAKIVDKYGETPMAPDGESGLVWEYGGEYNYPADSTAPIKYMSCASTLDVGNTLILAGLDSLGEEHTQPVVTNGQNLVTLTIPLWRSYRAQNVSARGSELNGYCYFHTSTSISGGVPTNTDDIKLVINGVSGQTLHAGYTVPKGFVAFLNRGEFGIGLEGGNQTTSEVAVVEYKSGALGAVFATKKRATLSNNGSSILQDYRIFGNPIPSFTDIEIHILDVSIDMRVWGTFNLLLMPEWYFPDSYLKGIRQPGYI